MLSKCTSHLISKGLSSYLSKADDSVGIIIGWDNYFHLTTKSNLSSTFWILQPDQELLLHLRDVIIYDVQGYLQLTITWRKVQLPKTECEKVKETQQAFQNSL